MLPELLSLRTSHFVRLGHSYHRQHTMRAFRQFDIATMHAGETQIASVPQALSLEATCLIDHRV